MTFTSTLALASLADAITVVSVTLFASDAVYAVVPDAKPGDSVTPLSESAPSVASADPPRVTVTVYARVVSPSSAVTSTAMTLPSPTSKPTTPSWSTTPLSFTSTLALASFAVAVTVVSVTLFATDAVYTNVPAANTGDSVTPLSESALRLASADPARVTVTMYVRVVSPSSAMTSMATVVWPTANATWSPNVWSSASSGVTSTLALPSLADAVTVVSVTPCSTDAVYAVVPDAKPGDSVTPLSESALKFASEDPARVTVTV